MNEQSVLPPAPWYTSDVQRAQVFAVVSGFLSTAVGVVIQLFNFSIDAAIVNMKVALVLQLVNLGFGAWGLLKRAMSQVQPLTLTAGAAVRRSERLPPILDSDPTKVPK